MKLTQLTETEYANLTSANISSIQTGIHLEEIISAFDKVLSFVCPNDGSLHLIAKKAKEYISDIKKPFNYSEITAFSELLVGYSDESFTAFFRASIFLTELINVHHTTIKNSFSDKKSSSDKKYEEYLIITKGYKQPLVFFGDEMNGPHIKILGNVGGQLGGNMQNTYIHVIGSVEGNCGIGMKSGTILVEGNAHDNVGYMMQGGEIIIKGNTRGYVGSNMSDGNISIHGNSTNQVGTDMKNGRIEIFGNVEDEVGHHMNGGKIIVRGNAGTFAGTCMNGGKIIIYGHADSRVGYLMNGGTISLEGTYNSLARLIPNKTKHSKIYHQGKQIFPVVKK